MLLPRDTILILDRENRIVCVLVGRPHGLSAAERVEWDSGVADLARAFEEERVRHQDEFERNLRGDFAAFATGFTMGPGSKVRGAAVTATACTNRRPRRSPATSAKRARPCVKWQSGFWPTASCDGSRGLPAVRSPSLYALQRQS